MYSLVDSIRADRACASDRPRAGLDLTFQVRTTQVDLDSTSLRVDRLGSDGASRAVRRLMTIPQAETGS